MDKYDEMAREFMNSKLEGYDIYLDGLFSMILRWYDEQREKETCETCEYRHLEPRVNGGNDELTVWCLNEESEMWDVQILHKGFCCNKYRRVEVKGNEQA